MTVLKLLTWNIWMMPAVLGLLRLSPSNVQRAEYVAEELSKLDYDILCLEKSFDEGARDAIKARLGAHYPYRYGPVNKDGSPLRFNGGVWVLSKFPLQPVHEIEYGANRSFEYWSRKGAMLLTGTIQGKAFQLVATHLQGEESKNYENQPIRDKQMRQIVRELLVPPYYDKTVPLFICGDFGTQRRDHKDPAQESPEYKAMLSRFDVVNGPEDRITLDDNLAHNDLAEYNTGRVAELDYILMRSAGAAISGEWRTHHLQARGWDSAKNRKDLSYRYAVGATFRWQ